MTKSNTLNLKGKALKKALKTKDQHRLAGIPLIQDQTILITPELAQKMLLKNKNNRPVNWNKVREYRRKMEAGEWEFHAQGIILDEKGNILTGQKRLYAVQQSGLPQYFRVSKGSPQKTAEYIDRGVAQSSRDLARRKTGRDHAMAEQGIARALYAIEGKNKVTLDEVYQKIVEYNEKFEYAIEQTKGVKKTKEMMMIIAALCHLDSLEELLGSADILIKEFKQELHPSEVDQCWNKGAAFAMAMKIAVNVCKKYI